MNSVDLFSQPLSAFGNEPFPVLSFSSAGEEKREYDMGRIKEAFTELYPEFRGKMLKLTDARAALPGEELEWAMQVEGELRYLLGVSLTDETVNLTSLCNQGVMNGRVPSDVARLLAFCEIEVEDESHRYDLDLYNAEAVQAFLEWFRRFDAKQSVEPARSTKYVCIHETRYRNAKPLCAPWSSALPDFFSRRYGYEIWKTLPSLVISQVGATIAHRCRFFQCVTELAAEAFWQPLGEFYRNTGMRRLRFSLSEELWKQLQLEGDVFQNADRLENAVIHVAIRNTRWQEDLPPSVVACKVATSIAHFVKNGKAVAGLPWTSENQPIRISDLNRWMNLLLGLGIQGIHGIASDHPAAKLRHTPSCPQTDQPWMQRMIQEYARFSALFSQGVASAALLALYPVRTFWGCFSLGAEDHALAEHLQEKLAQVCETLLLHHFDFHFISETMLSRIQPNNQGELSAVLPDGSEKRYAALIVPFNEVILSQTVEILERWAQAGVLIVFIEPIPHAVSDREDDAEVWERMEKLVIENDNVIAAEEGWLSEVQARVRPAIQLDSENRVVISRRRNHDSEDIFFLANLSPSERYEGNVTLTSSFDFMYEVDAASGNFQRLETQGPNPTFFLELEPFASRLFIVSKTRLKEAAEPVPLPGKPTRTIPLRDEFFFFTETGNYLPLRRWEIEPEAKDSPDSGERVRWTTRFWVREVCGSLTLVSEDRFFPGAMSDSNWKIVLNDRALELKNEGNRAGIPLSSWVWRGENILTLVWPSRPFAPIEGWKDFCLHGDFGLQKIGEYEVITAPSPVLRIGSWTEQGYPYYSGTGIYRQKVQIPEECLPSALFLRFAKVAEAVEIVINGKETGSLWKPPWRRRIDSWVVPGENLFEFRVSNSCWNGYQQPSRDSGLMGPVTLEVYSHVF